MHSIQKYKNTKIQNIPTVQNIKYVNYVDLIYNKIHNCIFETFRVVWRILDILKPDFVFVGVFCNIKLLILMCLSDSVLFSVHMKIF